MSLETTEKPKIWGHMDYLKYKTIYTYWLESIKYCLLGFFLVFTMLCAICNYENNPDNSLSNSTNLYLTHKCIVKLFPFLKRFLKGASLFRFDIIFKLYLTVEKIILRQ